jgi:predicted nucleotidyltransferase
MAFEQNSKLKKLIVDVAVRRYPGHSFLFFHGSWAKGEAREGSDVDLIVVYEKQIKPYRETYYEENYLFDVFLMDAESLHLNIQTSKQIGQYAMLNSLCDCITLPKSTKISDHLLSLARKIASSSDWPIPNRDSIRYFLGCLLKDLRACSEENERNFLAADLYQTLMTVTLMLRGRGGHTSKHVARELRRVDPNIQSQLDHALKLSLISGETSLLIELGNAVLEKLGGELKAGFKVMLKESGRLPLPA